MEDIGMKTKGRFVEAVIVCALLCLAMTIYISAAPNPAW
jgi:hypothetical protein